MTVFELLQEFAGEISYEHRKVKGSIARREFAKKWLEQEREDWLTDLEREV